MTQKGLFPIIILLIVLGGYLIYQNQTKTNSQPQPTTQPSSAPQEPAETNNDSATSSPTSTPKPVTKSGWKSYSDNGIGFNYQLPDDGKWLIRHTNNGGINNGLAFERNDGDQFITIAVYDNPKGLGRREFYCSNIVCNNPSEETLQDCLKTGITVQDTKVGNRDALYITQPGTQVDHAKVLNHNGKIVIVTDHSVSFPKTVLPEGFDWNNLRDEILSTFWSN